MGASASSQCEPLGQQQLLQEKQLAATRLGVRACPCLYAACQPISMPCRPSVVMIPGCQSQVEVKASTKSLLLHRGPACLRRGCLL